MTCIAHLSDLHFGRDLPSVTQGLLDSLAAVEPELIVISGDLTQRAKHTEFRQAAAFLQRLARPYIIVPGNHDLSSHRLVERFFRPWHKWRQYVGEELEPVLSQAGVTVAGVNTARRMGLYFDWSRGRINLRQTRHVAQVFADAPADHLRLVLAHHPFWLPQSSLSRSLVGRRDAALRAFGEAGVDLILGGHIHLAYVEPVRGMIVSHAGTTVSHRLIDGQPNSFNLIRGDRRSLEIEQWQWTGRAFGPGQSLRFHKRARGWQLC